jgi:hypothetical protein
MRFLAAVLLTIGLTSSSFAAERVLRVKTVRVTVLKSGLKIRAEGATSTNGWKNIQLRRGPSAGGTLSFDLVGDPPAGISNPVITSVNATTTWKGDFTTISHVVVNAKTNSVSVNVDHGGKSGKSLTSASVRSVQIKRSESVTVTCTCGSKSSSTTCPSEKNNTCDCSDPDHPKVICGS